VERCECSAIKVDGVCPVCSPLERPSRRARALKLKFRRREQESRERLISRKEVGAGAAAAGVPLGGWKK